MSNSISDRLARIAGEVNQTTEEPESPQNVSAKLTAIAHQVQQDEDASDGDDDDDALQRLKQIVHEEEQPADRSMSKLKEIAKQVHTEADDESEGGGEDDGDEEDELEREPLPQDSARELFALVVRGDLRQAKRFVSSQGGYAGCFDRHGWTPLHYAASGGHEELCELLLQSGVKPNTQDTLNGWTPLHVAAVNEKYKVAKFLLRHGASPTIRDNYGDLPWECIPPNIKGKKGEIARLLRKLLKPQADNNSEASGDDDEKPQKHIPTSRRHTRNQAPQWHEAKSSDAEGYSSAE